MGGLQFDTTEGRIMCGIKKVEYEIFNNSSMYIRFCADSPFRQSHFGRSNFLMINTRK